MRRQDRGGGATPPFLFPLTKYPDPGCVHPPPLCHPVVGFPSLFPLSASLRFLTEGMFCLPLHRILKTLRKAVTTLQK
jgi:hypothetical protein